MAESVPIPASIWQRIVGFLRTGATGQIVLDVHRGKVCSASLNEQIRQEDREEIAVKS